MKTIVLVSAILVCLASLATSQGWDPQGILKRNAMVDRQPWEPRMNMEVRRAMFQTPELRQDEDDDDEDDNDDDEDADRYEYFEDFVDTMKEVQKMHEKNMEQCEIDINNYQNDLAAQQSQSDLMDGKIEELQDKIVKANEGLELCNEFLAAQMS